MRKIAILLIALMMVSVGFLSGCNENSTKTSTNKEKILGIWLAYGTSGTHVAGNGTYTFFSNGTFLASSNADVWGTFEITDKKLTMSAESNTFTYDYTFSDNDNKVTLIDGSWTIILTKQ